MVAGDTVLNLGVGLLLEDTTVWYPQERCIVFSKSS